MEALFLAVLLGCSDDLEECSEFASWQVSATLADTCAEMTLARDEVRTADYPTVLAECHPLADSNPVLADAS